MYGECGKSDRVDDHFFYCAYNGSAIQQTSDEYLKIFKETCPHLYNGPQDTFSCCDMRQLESFVNDLSVPRQLMSRCPACFANFKGS